jgi:uncharacterized protein YndB with AHSA1/START domain
MELWLMKNNFQPVQGAEFQFKTNPIPSLNIDGIMHCKVLEIDPFKKLSYTWNCGPGNGQISLESIVVWKLEPTAKGTELFLEHSGFDKEENIVLYHGLMYGWMEKFPIIDNLLKDSKHVNTSV